MHKELSWIPLVCVIMAIAGCGAPAPLARGPVGVPVTASNLMAGACDGATGCSLAIRKAIRAKLEADDAAWVHSLSVKATGSGVVFEFEAVMRYEEGGAYAEVEGTYNTLSKKVVVTKRSPLAEAPGKSKKGS